MKYFVLLLVSCCVFLNGCQKHNHQDQADSDSLYYASHYTLKKVKMPMRDGVLLYAEISIPNNATALKKYPFLMSRTPYDARGGTQSLYHVGSYGKLLKEGYIFVFQDVRGRWNSGGTFVHERPEGPDADKKNQKTIDESTDTYDSIDWLLAHIENNNGNVGVFGISYPGFYTTAAALSNHPALKAVSPQAPVSDWFKGDDVHHNGAFFWMDFFTFLPGFDNDDPSGKRSSSFGVLPFLEADNYDYFLNKIKTPENANQHFFKDSVAFWKEIMKHPDQDTFWKSMNPLPHLYHIRAAVLTVGGWYDAEDLYGTLKTYQTLQKQDPQTENKIVMGPWYHGEWRWEGDSIGDISFESKTGFYYTDSLFIPFMNAHLKTGKEDGLAGATVFETGTNVWRKMKVWPPANTSDSNLYLEENNALGTQKPLSPSSFSEYRSDPSHPVPYQKTISFERTRDYMVDDQRFAYRRPDVLTFTSDTLKETITLAGPVSAALQVALSTSDADFVVKLIDVLPRPEYAKAASRVGDVSGAAPEQGYQHLVRAEIMRGKYRNSLEKPEPFKPGQITPVNFDLPDLFHTFQKGHRIMVQIQSSWFPLVDRNPQQFMNIYQAKPSDYIASDIRIYHDKDHPSHLVIRVLKN